MGDPPGRRFQPSAKEEKPIQLLWKPCCLAMQQVREEVDAINKRRGDPGIPVSGRRKEEFIQRYRENIRMDWKEEAALILSQKGEGPDG